MIAHVLIYIVSMFLSYCNALRKRGLYIGLHGKHIDQCNQTFGILLLFDYLVDMIN